MDWTTIILAAIGVFGVLGLLHLALMFYAVRKGMRTMDDFRKDDDDFWQR